MGSEFSVIGAETIVSAITYGLPGLGSVVISADSCDTDFRVRANLARLGARHEHRPPHEILSRQAI
ncbi:hypothetical protein [Bosea sp. (in: a-proteobacteria)]|jgi:hypothetical protein|uniref:hypothetical protein n=1 Tax=Bosea sp. (in: a-proteobacteria) TaxID=1871050 RepID=UPI003F6EFA0B